MRKVVRIIIVLFALKIVFVDCIFGNDNNEQMERRNRFINEGFGLNIISDEIENVELFVLNHGNPLNIRFISEDDPHFPYIDGEKMLEYETVFVRFSAQRERGSNYYNFHLRGIHGKAGVNFLYNIRIGMTVNELEEIIGEVERRTLSAAHGPGVRPQTTSVLTGEDFRVMMTFSGDTLRLIEWIIPF